MKRCSATLVEVLIALIIISTMLSALSFAIFRANASAQFSQSADRIEHLFSQAIHFSSLTGKEGSVILYKTNKQWYGYFDLFTSSAKRFTALTKAPPSSIQLKQLSKIRLNDHYLSEIKLSFYAHTGLFYIEAKDEFGSLLTAHQLGFNFSNPEKKSDFSLELFPLASHLSKKSIYRENFVTTIHTYVPFPNDLLSQE